MKRNFLLIIFTLLMLTGCSDKNYSNFNQINQTEKSCDILVDIKGAVKYPGVYAISNSSIMKDVIEIAGGFLENADTSKVNLVRSITSNEMIIIPFKVSNNNEYTDKININTATLSELMRIPKIGETRAKAIIDYRNNQGSFASLEDLIKVSGISETIVSQIKAYITI